MGNNALDDDGNDDGSNPNTDFTDVNFAYSSLSATTIKFETLETRGPGLGGPNFKKARIGVSENLKFSDNSWGGVYNQEEGEWEGGADFSSASLLSGEGARM